MGKYDRYWEMNQGTKDVGTDQIFKCTDCGATTTPGEGHNGEPDPAQCAAHCSSREAFDDWEPGGVSRQYTEKYTEIKFTPGHKGLKRAVVQRGARVVTRYIPKGA